MNITTNQVVKDSRKFIRLFFNVAKGQQSGNVAKFASYASFDSIDAFAIELVQRHTANSKLKPPQNGLPSRDVAVRYFMNAKDTTPEINVDTLTSNELQKHILDILAWNKDSEMRKLIEQCNLKKKAISKTTLEKLFNTYSAAGKIDMVNILQEHSLILNPVNYSFNGEYQHFVAKAECMRGNSEKGLSILKECYTKNEGLRQLYRLLFRELIHDSVLNRSEATMVIFRRHVLEYSERCNDHYPLICLWHICWVSTWFSDQILASDLLEASETLKDIIKEKATAFSISVLRNEYNEDAVIRLLQYLLKYAMMDEYVKVLQVLFAYKLKRNDLRGCKEIIRNCETLGVSLSANYQSKYVQRLIEGPKNKNNDGPKPHSTNFKFKF